MGKEPEFERILPDFGDSLLRQQHPVSREELNELALLAHGVRDVYQALKHEQLYPGIPDSLYQFHVGATAVTCYIIEPKKRFPDVKLYVKHPIGDELVSPLIESNVFLYGIQEFDLLNRSYFKRGRKYDSIAHRPDHEMYNPVKNEVTSIETRFPMYGRKQPVHDRIRRANKDRSVLRKIIHAETPDEITYHQYHELKYILQEGVELKRSRSNERKDEN